MSDASPVSDRAVVVTGASTGIGWSCAEELTKAGFHVFATVRKAEDADRLRAALGNRVTPLIMDVTDSDAVKAAGREVRAALGGRTLFGLVNNAGVAVAGPLMHMPEEEVRNQFEINVMGVVRTTQTFGPLLGVPMPDDETPLTGPPGRIVMISSVAGKMGSPFLGPYAASKHAVEGLSESLRRELMLYGVDVIIVGPGAVSTPIWEKANDLDITPYQDTEYLPILEKLRDYMVANGATGFPPKKIADTVIHALTTAKPKTRYAVVPKAFSNWTVPRLLPTRMVDNIIAKRLGLKRKQS